jgi:hypothetical protein
VGKRLAIGAIRALAGMTAEDLLTLAPAAVVFGGVLLAPSQNNEETWRDVPGRPGLRYRVSLWTPEAWVKYRDAAGKAQTVHLQIRRNAVIDDSGETVGRVLAGGRLAIALDAVAPGTVGDEEPRLCPKPTPDKPGQGPDSRSRAYENQMKRWLNPQMPTPPGLGMALTGAKGTYIFDDCRQSNGDMVDYKGPGYAWAVTAAAHSPKANWTFKKKWLQQSASQVSVAGSRQIVWYFAEPSAAASCRRLFIQQDKGRERIQIRVKAFAGG